MKYIAICFLGVLIFSCGSVNPSIKEIKISNVINSGTGCDDKNGKIKVKPYRSDSMWINGFDISFSNFLVELNEKTSGDDKKKTCNFEFDITTDNNWEYKITSVLINGKAKLHPDNLLGVTHTHRFHKKSDEKKASKSFLTNKTTSKNGIESYSIILEGKDLIWSGCKNSKRIFINTLLEIRGEQKELENIFDISEPGGQRFLVEWRRC